MAAITATVTTNLAAPDGHKGARVAIGASPRQNVAISSLHNGEDVARALVRHIAEISFEGLGLKL